MPINTWTKKFMLRPVTHYRSGCEGARRIAQSAWRMAWNLEELVGRNTHSAKRMAHGAGRRVDSDSVNQ